MLCPTAEEVAECERGYELLGYEFGGREVTAECTGAPGECRIGDRCVTGQTRDPLPIGMRRYADFAWQRNPYEIGNQPRRPGRKQSPGLDLTESYWLARFYGFITEGDGQVLAWRDAGPCEP